MPRTRKRKRHESVAMEGSHNPLPRPAAESEDEHARVDKAPWSAQAP